MTTTGQNESYSLNSNKGTLLDKHKSNMIKRVF